MNEYCWSICVRNAFWKTRGKESAMKKLLACVFVLVVLSGCAATHKAWTEKSASYNPNSHKRVAIFPLSGDLTGSVQDALGTELLAMGYDVVERSNIKAIMNEMNLGYSGILDTAQTKDVARATNADAIIFGSARTTVSGNIYFIDLRFVDINTGEILWSSNYSNTNFVEPRQSIVLVSKSIQDKLNKPIVASKTATFGEARLSIARNQAVSSGPYKKVALLPLFGTHRYGQDNALYGALLTSLLGDGVDLVERKELDNILQEQKKGESGLYAPVTEDKSILGKSHSAEVLGSTVPVNREYAFTATQLAELGKVTGADAMLMGSFEPNYSLPFYFKFASLRLVDLASGKIAWSGTYFNKVIMPENYILAADWLATAFSPLIVAESPKDYDAKIKSVLKTKKASGASIIEFLHHGDQPIIFNKGWGAPSRSEGR